MWYENSYRRHLSDMHIDDWNEEFLARYSSEEYVRLLKMAKAQTVMLYYQSHVGLCNYPNKAGLLHKAFVGREDAVRRTEQLCHENGISVVGYYSLIFNNRMAERHPEWEMRFVDGRTAGQIGRRYLKCCPNQSGYREFVLEQIEEILEYFHPDGMFFDMPYWPQPCYCTACQNRWKQETGGEMPIEKKDERIPELNRARMHWMAEFAELVAEHTRKIRPDLTVEFNYAYAALGEMEPAMSEEVGRAGDYVGGDLYGNLISQSIICKYYSNVSVKLPFEYMTCRCMPNLQNHTVLKSLHRLKQAAHLTLAHQGASLFIDAIDPRGTWDERVYKRLGEVAEATSVYERYISGKRIATVGVIYMQQCKEYPEARGGNHYTGVMGAVETMIRQHIPVDVVARASFDRLQEYSVLILPEAAYMDEAAVSALEEYVNAGGTLYFSGVGEGTLLENLTGGKYIGNTADGYTYLAPYGRGCTLMEDYSETYPLPFEGCLPLVESIAEEYVLAKIALPYQTEQKDQFVSIHSNPPGVLTSYPGIAEFSYGKGRVIWSAAPLESVAVCDYRKILLKLLGEKRCKGNWKLETTAPSAVELLLLQGEDNTIRISVIDLRDMDQEEIISSFEISIEGGLAEEVRLLPVGEKIPFRQDGDKTIFQTRPLNIYDMYEIKMY